MRYNELIEKKLTVVAEVLGGKLLSMRPAQEATESSSVEKDTQAGSRNSLCCALLSLILIGHLAACSIPSNLSSGTQERPSEEVPKARKLPMVDSPQADSAQKFEGEWSYRDDCGHGHYVTLELKRENDQLIGSWSDGTLLRGSQGLLKGRVSKDRLVAEWCSEYEEAGAPALCPRYGRSEDYLVARDGKIVWYQKYGQEYSEYVVLTKGNKSQRSTKACDDDN